MKHVFFNEILQLQGEYTLHIEGNTQPCMNHFAYHWEPDAINLSKAEIFYTKSDGTTYSTHTPLNANPNFHIDINSVADYTGGMEGKAAKQINATIHAWLINMENADDIILLENLSGTFGFVIEP